ncbi:hypothetical protein LguiA_001945 [Lonicera macranthoides]
MKERDRGKSQYIKGVAEFLSFIVENGGGEEKFSCPCNKCENGRLLEIKDIHFHLLRYGILQSYTFWHFHGEKESTNVETNTTPNIGEQDIVPEDPRLEDLVYDSFEMFNREVNNLIDDINSNEDGESSSYVGTRLKFKDLCGKASEPLYPSCLDKQTTLYFLVKLNNVKTRFGLFDNSFTDILGLFKEFLPEGNTTPTKYSEMKNIIKEVGMDYEVIGKGRIDSSPREMIHGHIIDFKEEVVLIVEKETLCLILYIARKAVSGLMTVRAFPFVFHEAKTKKIDFSWGVGLQPPEQPASDNMLRESLSQKFKLLRRGIKVNIMLNKFLSRAVDLDPEPQSMAVDLNPEYYRRFGYHKQTRRFSHTLEDEEMPEVQEEEASNNIRGSLEFDVDSLLTQVSGLIIQASGGRSQALDLISQADGARGQALDLTSQIGDARSQSCNAKSKAPIDYEQLKTLMPCDIVAEEDLTKTDVCRRKIGDHGVAVSDINTLNDQELEGRVPHLKEYVKLSPLLLQILRSDLGQEF